MLPDRTAIVMLDYACDSETGGDVLYKQAVR